ncbi:MAG: hypothetical protein M3430_13335 [Acidobacteriota bacterium]|nr:hypothetical protein [Acidobacteriota bacterium]
MALRHAREEGERRVAARFDKRRVTDEGDAFKLSRFVAAAVERAAIERAMPLSYIIPAMATVCSGRSARNARTSSLCSGASGRALKELSLSRNAGGQIGVGADTASAFCPDIVLLLRKGKGS